MEIFEEPRVIIFSQCTFGVGVHIASEVSMNP